MSFDDEQNFSGAQLKNHRAFHQRISINIVNNLSPDSSTRHEIGRISVLGFISAVLSFNGSASIQRVSSPYSETVSCPLLVHILGNSDSITNIVFIFGSKHCPKIKRNVVNFQRCEMSYNFLKTENHEKIHTMGRFSPGKKLYKAKQSLNLKV